MRVEGSEFPVFAVAREREDGFRVDDLGGWGPGRFLGLKTFGSDDFDPRPSE